MVEHDIVHWAFIVGGYPDAIKTTQNKLLKEGINTSGSASTSVTAIPKNTTFILYLTDNISHSLRGEVENLLGDSKIKRIYGRAFAWSETRMSLVRSGIITSETGMATIKEITDAKKVREEKDPQEHLDKDKFRSSMEAIVYKVLESHKPDLTRITSYEIADEASKLYGSSISPSAVNHIREKFNFPKTPKGFKRPRQPKEQMTSSSSTAENSEKEFRTIQSLLEEWRRKYNIKKLYVTYDNDKWDANYEQLALVSKDMKF